MSTLLKRLGKVCIYLYCMSRKPGYLLRLKRLWRKKRFDGAHTYSVVTSVYNVAPYLDCFFRSLTGQTLDFSRHIQLILVDDGSTDDSAAIIRRWQERFPDNIRYIYQENSGLGAARNSGLSLVTEPWVIFLDPDDFIACDFFSVADDFLRRQHRETPADERIKVLACNYIFYFEQDRTFRDTHPLRHRFFPSERILDCGAPKAVQLSVNSAFLNRMMLAASGLLFDERRWLSFEDAHLMLRFLHDGQAGRLAYVGEARYFYRKRKAGTSNLDLGQRSKVSYLDLFRQSHIPLLEQRMARHGCIPEAMQWTFLYNCMVYLRLLLGPFPIKQVLSPAEQQEFFTLLRQVFSYIDDRVILETDKGIKRFDAVMKDAVLVCFKDRPMSCCLVRISGYNPIRRRLSLTYTAPMVSEEELAVDGSACQPLARHCLGKELLGHPFLTECRLDFRLPKGAKLLTLRVNGIDSVFHYRGRRYEKVFPLRALPLFFG
ncbi:glycosyltransferase [Desulfovibrio sp. OttesenSCG-928-A18]|nr:glycosyltransferase [Desulfovibrio sp. OttesenSCG-928-A18]